MALQQAQDAVRRGDLDAARALLTDATRAAPADPALRAFLFQLACIDGDWTRASRALDALAGLRPEALDLVADYRAAIAAEATRAAVFAGRTPPDVFGGARGWTGDLVAALAAEAAGDADGAAALRTRALAAAPADAGAADGQPFAWIGDGDSRLGPVLEAVMNGAYRWIPFCELAALEIAPPADLRDAVWAVAVATFRAEGDAAGGAQWPILIPARYPGSEAAADPAIRLGRRTEWRALGGDHAAGLGQRELVHDAGEIALLELRSLSFAGAAP